MSCSNCKKWLCRCSDCAFLTRDKNGDGRSLGWYCDEYQKACCDVEECFEYLPDSGCDEVE